MLGTIGLRCVQTIIKVITNQIDRHLIATKDFCFLDFLLRRCDRHKNAPGHPKLATHIGHPLSMVAGTGTNEILLIWQFAHRIKRPTQFIGPHGRQVFAFEPDISLIHGAQMVIFLQRCRCKNITKGGFGFFGKGLKIAHPSVLAQGFCEGKDETPTSTGDPQYNGRKSL